MSSVDRALRGAGVVISALGLVLVVAGIHGFRHLPAARPEPMLTDDFLHRRISLDEFSQRQEEWSDSEWKRRFLTVGAFGILAVGAVMSIAGGSLLLASSRRLRGATYRAPGRPAQPVIPAEAPERGHSVQVRLEELARLQARGLVTDDEFAAKRQAILAEL